MSDKPDIEAIKARVRDAERSLDDQKSDWCRSDLARRLVADIAALLAEVERLQRERSEWCDRADVLMTEHMTQMRDLTAEVEALRARLTLTPERVEAAAKADYEFDNPGGPEFKDCAIRCLYLDAARAALLAAGMEEEQ